MPQSTRALNDPSDLFDAIADTLRARLIEGVRIEDYADFDETGLARLHVLIEFERTGPAARANDGRHAEEFELAIHAVVSRGHQRANLTAVDLASAIARIVEGNTWGLPGNQIEFPDAIHAEPTMFKRGSSGYEAWGVYFRQVIKLGASLLEADPVTTAMPFVNSAPGDEWAAFEEV